MVSNIGDGGYKLQAYMKGISIMGNLEKTTPKTSQTNMEHDLTLILEDRGLSHKCQQCQDFSIGFLAFVML